MESSYKRKLDCLVDNMDVVVGESPPGFCFYGGGGWRGDEGRESKKLKICLNARLVEPMSAVAGVGFCDGVDDGWEERGDLEEDGDIPSTSEVIHSLRKVMLWMSAQEDTAPDQLQFLNDVERYALSKRDAFAQQRKITEYFKHH